MRSVKGKSWLPALCAALAVTAVNARADVTVEEGASIIFFPKVIADGTRDTAIQISNISNETVSVQLFALQGDFCAKGVAVNARARMVWVKSRYAMRAVPFKRCCDFKHCDSLLQTLYTL